MYFRCKACNKLRNELELELDEEFCEECAGVSNNAAQELEGDDYGSYENEG